MSKYKSRINKLMVKTHNFISHQELCLVRDYHKAQFDAMEKPDDFEKQYKDFLELNEKFDATNDPLLEAQIDEIFETNQAIRLMQLYESGIEICRTYPNGDWGHKSVSDCFLTVIEDAKKYFKINKS